MGELNLIPYELKEKKKGNLKKLKYIMIGCSILIVLIIAILVPEIKLYFMKKEKASMDAQITSGAAILNENKNLNTQIDSINEYINKVQLLSKQRVIVSDEINGVNKYVPKEVVLKNLGFTTGEISLTATTQRYNAISEFTANLQMSKEYSRAEITNITYNAQQTKYTFTLVITGVGGVSSEKTK